VLLLVAVAHAQVAVGVLAELAAHLHQCKAGVGLAFTQRDDGAIGVHGAVTQNGIECVALSVQRVR
jgi:glycine betaine/choline ABC-type transport system substrate-binding protein